MRVHEISSSWVPLRASLLGGGSDLPAFLDTGHDGYCLSLTLNVGVKACGVKSDGLGRMRLTDCDTPLTRAVIARLDPTLSAFSHVWCEHDLGAYGTGLGSSAAWVRALINLYATHASTNAAAGAMGPIEAFRLERSTGSRCGLQDHAAAYYAADALYCFSLNSTGEYCYSNVMINDDYNHVRDWLAAFRIGVPRDSNVILSLQEESMKGNNVLTTAASTLNNMADQALRGYGLLHLCDYVKLGEQVTYGWYMKRTFDGVSNPTVDAVIDAVIDAGAVGAKLLGAGGSGYVLAVRPPSHADVVNDAALAANAIPEPRLFRKIK